MVLLLIAAPIAWFTVGPVVSSLMARRGYDRTAWLVVGLLFGPIAAVFAVMEVVWAMPRRAQTIQSGKAGGGTVDALVALVGDDLELAKVATQAIGDDVHQLALARVLPFDGAKDVERAVAARLRQEATLLGHPEAELVLLFGTPVGAITRFTSERAIDVVVTDREIPDLAARPPEIARRAVARPRAPARVASGSEARS